MAVASLSAAVGVNAAAPTTLRIGIAHTASATGLNPFVATESTDWLLMSDIYDLLIEFGPNLDPAPGLADAWQTSADGLTWTYHIRDGALWQDGQPVTAQDVAFTFNFLRNSHDPAYKGPQAPDGNDVTGADGGGKDGAADYPLTLFDNYLDLDQGFANTRITSVATTDDHTVVIKTSVPIVTLAQLYIPIVPKHTWDTITYKQISDGYTPTAPIGSGPFIIKEFKSDQFMRFEAFKNYWGGAPRVDQLIYQYFQNDEASVQALLNDNPANGVDMLLEVPPTLVSEVQHDPRVTFFTGTASDFTELGFNSWNPTPQRFKKEGCADCPKGPTTGSLGNPWLTKPEVRAALSQLVDKSALVDVALRGFGAPGESLVGPYNQRYYYQPPTDDPAKYPGTHEAAIARFRSVMEGLGFSDTDGDGILNVPNTPEAQAFDPAGAGKNWSLRLFVRQDNAKDKTAAPLIAQWMTDAGAKVTVEERKENGGSGREQDFYTFTYPSLSNADMDMYIWGFGPDPDPDFILSIFTCNQINNWQDANFCDPAYDTQYATSRTATNLDERASIVKQLQAKVYSAAPYSVLWYNAVVEAYRSDRWEGLHPHPSQNGDLWGAWGFGPYGSRLTVAPVGSTPSATPSPAITEPPPSGTPGASAPSTPAATPLASGEPAASASAGATAAPSPTPTAIAVGPTPAASAAPTPAASTPPGNGGGGGGGNNTPVIVGGAVVAVAAVGGVMWWRRRAERDDE